MPSNSDARNFLHSHSCAVIECERTCFHRGACRFSRSPEQSLFHPHWTMHSSKTGRLSRRRDEDLGTLEPSSEGIERAPHPFLWCAEPFRAAVIGIPLKKNKPPDLLCGFPMYQHIHRYGGGISLCSSISLPALVLPMKLASSPTSFVLLARSAVVTLTVPVTRGRYDK